MGQLAAVLIGWLASRLGRTGAAIAFYVTSMTVLTGALAFSFGAMLNTMQVTMPPEFALGLGMLPSNTPLCASSVLTAALLRWVYDSHAVLIKDIHVASFIR